MNESILNACINILPYIAVVIIILILVKAVSGRYYYGEPNEWVLVIKNGELQNCGIGLQGIKYIGQTIVKFPSTINKVNFTAEQVTKEMQGIRVTGFLIWSIFREGDGPFKAFKMLNNLASSPEYANESVARMAESIVRHNVANLSIQEVITQRHQIRDRMRNEMLDVVKGWGVWLETVEITDVYVLSKSLFENMQTDYRQQQRKEAEKVKAQTNREIKEKQIEVSAALKREEAESSTATAIYVAKQQLLKEQEDEKLQLERLRIEQQKLEQQKAIEVTKRMNKNVLQKLEQEQAHELAKSKLHDESERADVRYEIEKKNQDVLKLKHETELEILKARNEVENTFIDLKKINAVSNIYKNVNDVRVVNLGGGGGGGSDQLIANAVAAYRSINDVVQQ